jgi:hypothetical protein
MCPLIFCSRRAREAGNPASGQKGRGLGGRNFCPPSLSAAAEFRISLCEMRRQEKGCCVCPTRPCAHNNFTPLFTFPNFWYSIEVVERKYNLIL